MDIFKKYQFNRLIKKIQNHHHPSDNREIIEKLLSLVQKKASLAKTLFNNEALIALLNTQQQAMIICAHYYNKSFLDKELFNKLISNKQLLLAFKKKYQPIKYKTSFLKKIRSILSFGLIKNKQQYSPKEATVFLLEKSDELKLSNTLIENKTYLSLLSSEEVESIARQEKYHTGLAEVLENYFHSPETKENRTLAFMIPILIEKEEVTKKINPENIHSLVNQANLSQIPVPIIQALLNNTQNKAIQKIVNNYTTLFLKKDSSSENDYDALQLLIKQENTSEIIRGDEISETLSNLLLTEEKGMRNILESLPEEKDQILINALNPSSKRALLERKIEDFAESQEKQAISTYESKILSSINHNDIKNIILSRKEDKNQLTAIKKILKLSKIDKQKTITLEESIKNSIAHLLYEDYEIVTHFSRNKKEILGNLTYLCQLSETSSYIRDNLISNQLIQELYEVMLQKKTQDPSEENIDNITTICNLLIKTITAYAESFANDSKKVFFSTEEQTLLSRLRELIRENKEPDELLHQSDLALLGISEEDIAQMSAANLSNTCQALFLQYRSQSIEINPDTDSDFQTNIQAIQQKYPNRSTDPSEQASFQQEENQLISDLKAIRQNENKAMIEKIQATYKRLMQGIDHSNNEFSQSGSSRLVSSVLPQNSRAQDSKKSIASHANNPPTPNGQYSNQSLFKPQKTKDPNAEKTTQKKSNIFSNLRKRVLGH